jgi:RHS repeat-associated protein
MTADGRTGYAYTFDAENHMTQASGTPSGSWNYSYDGNGLRVEKTNGTTGTLYWRDLAGNTIAETDLTGSTTDSAYREYIFFAGQRVAQRDATTPTPNVYFYYPDEVGSTTAISTAAGVSCYQATFTPYGQEMATQTTCSTNYKFTGYERDAETGFDYAFARYYSSTLGRFMSPDPFGGDTSDPQSFNRYAYTGNNPTNYTDPSGLLKYPCRGTGAVCGGGGGWNGGVCTVNGGGLTDCSGLYNALIIDTMFQASYTFSAGPFNFNWNKFSLGELLDMADEGSEISLVDVTISGGWQVFGGSGGYSWSDLAKGLRKYFTGNPCRKGNVSALDYSSPYPYASGADTPLNHITQNHITGGPNKSQYIFQDNVTSLSDQQNAVVNLNAVVFLAGSATIQSNGNIAYTLTIPSFIDPKTGTVYSGVGTDRNNGNAVTNTATLVISGNCKQVVTSFPGTPGGKGPNP